MLTFFCALLATGWLATVMTAFCPLRSRRKKLLLQECERLERGRYRQ